MAKLLGDLISPEVRVQFPDNALNPKARALLAMPVPAEIPENELSLLGQKLSDTLPRMTIAAGNPMLSAHQAEARAAVPGAPDYPRAAAALRSYGERPLPMQLAEQAGAGAVQTMPSFRETPYLDVGLTPEPRNLAERLARAAGSVGMFGIEAAPLTVALGPMAGAAIPAALQPGNWKQRTARGASMAVSGGLLRGTLGTVARTAGPAAARTVALPAGAAAFGALAPTLEVAGEKAMGEHVDWLGAEAMARRAAELAIIGGVSMAAGHVRPGARPAPAPRAPGQLALPPAEATPGTAIIPAPTLSPAPEAPVAPATRLAADFLAKVPAAARPAVISIARGNRGVGPKGPLDALTKQVALGGQTELEHFVERVVSNTGGTPDPKAWIEAARDTRSRIKASRTPQGVAQAPVAPGGAETPAPAPKATAPATPAPAPEYEPLSDTLTPDPRKAAALAARYRAKVPGSVAKVERAEGGWVVSVRKGSELLGRAPVEPKGGQPTAVPQVAAPVSEREVTPAPQAPPAEKRGVPAYLADEIKRRVEIANKAGVSDEIEELAAQGLTARQIGNKIGPRLPAEDTFAREGIIRAVRSDRGIPSVENHTEFESWKKERAKPEARTAKAVPGVAEGEASIPTPKQEALAVGPRELPAGPKVRATPAAAEAVAAMGEPARSFDEHFVDLVKKGVPAEEARAEAEKLSGGAAPPTFDAEARAKSLLHRAAEEAGQTSLFGGEPEKKAAPAPTPAPRAEAKPPAPKPEGAAKHPDGTRVMLGGGAMETGTVRSTKAGKVEVELDTGGARTIAEKSLTALPGAKPRASESKPATGVEMVRAQSLHFHEPFQQRDVNKGLVDQEHLQNLLQRHGGYSAEAMAESPATVWRDEKGEIGPEGRVYVLGGHHRTHIAQHEWEKLDTGEIAATSTSDREIPVVFHKGDYASALEKAETSNLQGKPNTMVEQAGVVRRLTDRGASLKEVAAKATGGKETKARDLLALSHLAPDLQRQYFGEGGLGLNIGAYVGGVTKRYSIDPEHQKQMLARVGDGRISSIEELQDQVNGYLNVLRATDQLELLKQYDMGEKAISFGMANDYLGRPIRVVGKEKRAAEAGLRATKKVLESGGTPEELEGARVLTARHRRELARTVELAEQVQGRTIKAVEKATAEGRSMADALYDVQRWIEEQMKPRPPDEIGATSIFSEGAAGVLGAARWISREARRGIQGARERWLQSRGKGAHEWKIVDGETGNTIDRGTLVEFMDDPYSDDAFLRNAARLGVLTTGDIILPPRVQNEYRAGQAAEALYEDYYRQRWEDALGSKAAVRYFAEGSTGSIELGKALEGKKHSIPAEFVGAVKRLKALLDEVHALESQHAHEMGQEPPPYRADYGFPHLVEAERSSHLNKMLALVEGRPEREIADSEMKERRNRFYNRREGDPRYLRDASAAIRSRLQESARKLAHDRVLKAAVEYLGSEPAIGVDRDRANLVRDWLRSTYFRKTSAWEDHLNRGMRRLLFAKVRLGIVDVPLEQAAKFTGTTVDALKMSGVERVSLIPKGVEDYSAPKDAREIGKSSDGGTYLGYGREGVVLNRDLPVAKEWVRSMLDAHTDLVKRFTGRLRDSEERFRHESKVDRMVLDLERNPVAIVSSLWTGATSRGLLGWNVRAAHVNAGGTLITTLPEYGALPFIEGARGASVALRNKAVRKAINLLESRGWLKGEQAAQARKMIPLVREEVYAEAAGVHQGEVRGAQQRLRDIAEGHDPEAMRVLRALGPYGMFSAGEGWNRSLSIVAADSYARRTLGLERKAPDIYEGMMEARRQILDAMIERGSSERYAAAQTYLTQFAYNALGQPMWAQGPFGRIVFQMGTWPLNYAKNYVWRPTRGAARVGAAAARGGINALLGGRLGKAERKIPDDFLRRGIKPEPKNWFEAWLEHNGAGYSERHAGAVFLRQMAVSAVLVGLAEATHVNVAVYGTAPQFVALLWLLRRIFPDDDTLASWYKAAAYGSAMNLARGLPMTPTISVAQDVGREVARRMRSGEQSGEGGVSQYFPWETTLEVARRTLVKGEVEWRRWVEENPEKFETVPWIFKAYGIKKGLYEATKTEKLKHHLGLMTPEDAQQLRQEVPEP